MSKYFQLAIVEQAKVIVQELSNGGFFEEFEISDTTFAVDHLCEKLTEKFIEGKFDSSSIMFSEEEFTSLLQDIIAGSYLYSLKEKGYINSYEDENTEETFFLTEEGKEYIKNNNIDLDNAA
jgi:hypothetical protein